VGAFSRLARIVQAHPDCRVIHSRHRKRLGRLKKLVELTRSRRENQVLVDLIGQPPQHPCVWLARRSCGGHHRRYATTDSQDPVPGRTTHPVALARSSNMPRSTRNRCTEPAGTLTPCTSLLKCPRQDCAKPPSRPKRLEKLSPFRRCPPSAAARQ